MTTHKKRSREFTGFPPRLTEGLDSFSLEVFQRRFEKLTDDKKSEALGKFFLREILAPTIDDLGDDEINENWLDVAKDKGVDFLYRRNNQVLILQSKFRQPKATINRSELDQTRNILRTLKNVDPEKDLPELVTRCQDIEWEKDSFGVYFLCSCPVSPALKKDFDSRDVNREEERLADFAVVDLPELEKLYDLELNTEGSLPDSITLDVVHSGKWPNCVIIDQPRPMYLFLTTGTSLVAAYKEHEHALFHYNVRFSLGRTKVNEGIMKTAREHPEHFVSYNNGVSCIAENATLLDDPVRITCKRLQVINGAQTVSSLANPQVLEAKLDKIEVAVKLTLVENLTRPVAAELNYVEGIVRSNNTQNPTKFADSRSRDKLHRSLVTFFGKEMFGGKNVEYRPKRIRKDASTEKSVYKIHLEDFCKTLYAFLYNPVEFTSDSSFLFNLEHKGGYLKLFGEDERLPLTLGREKCAYYAGIWWICGLARLELVDDRKELRQSDKTQVTEEVTEDHQALERAYFVYSAMRMLIEKRGYLEDVARYSSPKWREEKTSRQFTIIKKYYKQAKWMVIKSHREVLEKGKSHRSWLSSPDTLRSIGSFKGAVDDDSLPDLTDF